MKWALCLFLVACSGADEPILDSGVMDGGAKPDTGKPDTGKPDTSGGMDFVSTPGDIPCGNVTCTSSGFACCFTRNGTMTMVSCSDPGTCPTGPNSVELQCDEAADCPMGQVCCKNGAVTSCTGSCMGTQICTKSAECGSSGACKAYACPVEGTVHACGLPMGCK